MAGEEDRSVLPQPFLLFADALHVVSSHTYRAIAVVTTHRKALGLVSRSPSPQLRNWKPL